MAIPYTKPGVYVEETLLPNTQAASAAIPATATFIGYTDRGPTTGAAGSVTAVPTLVTSWSDFINNFSFSTKINTFSGIPNVVLYGATLSTTSTTVTVDSGASALKVGSLLPTSAGFSAGTVVTAIASDTSFTVSAAPTTATSGVSLSVSPAVDMKYALKAYFDNGGSQAYIVRDINTDALKSSVTLRDSNNTVVTSGNITYDYNTTNAGNKVLTLTAASGTPFANFTAGQVVKLSGISSSDYTFLNNTNGTPKWVVVTATDTVLTLRVEGLGSKSVATASSPVTVVGGGRSAANALTITAKNHGSWGNKIWVAVTPNVIEGYFDLTVYYAPSGTPTSANIVDSAFTQLSMDPTNERYFANVVNSTWIDVADAGSSATGVYRLPAFTGAWDTAITASSTSGTNGNFSYSPASFIASTPVQVGSTTAGGVISSGVLGSDGSSVRDSSVLISSLDAVTSPLLINWPNKTASADVNAMLTYAATRADSFVIIDAPNTSVVSSALSTISAYSSHSNYGAAYYPNIVVPDPTSTTNPPISIPPGAAVAAVYATTDASRGVFKAPAGTTSIIGSAVSVRALSAQEFTDVTNNVYNLNIIRFIPGSGICVMGARTLSSAYTDRYVPVRRTVNYISSSLVDITEFALFEPNDVNLWGNVTGVIGNFLTDLWRSGGLAGDTADAAFYVICDGTINTTQSIQAGELHVEVGVALQRPAEFVIIRLGQLNGAATVTTTL